MYEEIRWGRGWGKGKGLSSHHVPGRGNFIMLTYGGCCHTTLNWFKNDRLSMKHNLSINDTEQVKLRIKWVPKKSSCSSFLYVCYLSIRLQFVMVQRCTVVMLQVVVKNGQKTIPFAPAAAYLWLQFNHRKPLLLRL